MSKVLIEEQTLYDIGDAIRARNGLDTTYKPGEMARAIRNVITNQSLVINGNFTHPANTGNKTTYTGYNGPSASESSRRCINGWCYQEPETVVELLSSGLRISSHVDDTVLNLYQKVRTNSYPSLPDTTLTLSVIANDEFKTTTFIYSSNEMTNNTIHFAPVDANGRDVYVGVYYNAVDEMGIAAYSPGHYLAETSFVLNAIKLEFGAISTLLYEEDASTGKCVPLFNIDQYKCDVVLGYYHVRVW